jgi:hypothetical protein
VERKFGRNLETIAEVGVAGVPIVGGPISAALNARVTRELTRRVDFLGQVVDMLEVQGRDLATSMRDERTACFVDRAEVLSGFVDADLRSMLAKLVAAVLSQTTEVPAGEILLSALERLSSAHLAVLGELRDLQLHGAGRDDASVLPEELTSVDESIRDAVVQGLVTAGMLLSHGTYGGSARHTVSKLGFLVLEIIDNP